GCTRSTNERAVESTRTAPSARRAPVATSISHAPFDDMRIAVSIPGEATPAPAGHALPPVAAESSVSRANSAMGTLGLASVFQSTRHQLASGVSPTAVRKMSAPFISASPVGYVYVPALAARPATGKS